MHMQSNGKADCHTSLILHSTEFLTTCYKMRSSVLRHSLEQRRVQQDSVAEQYLASSFQLPRTWYLSGMYLTQPG